MSATQENYHEYVSYCGGVEFHTSMGGRIGIWHSLRVRFNLLTIPES